MRTTNVHPITSRPRPLLELTLHSTAQSVTREIRCCNYEHGNITTYGSGSLNVAKVQSAEPAGRCIPIDGLLTAEDGCGDTLGMSIALELRV
jgi:hypothetical protein